MTRETTTSNPNEEQIKIKAERLTKFTETKQKFLRFLGGLMSDLSMERSRKFDVANQIESKLDSSEWSELRQLLDTFSDIGENYDIAKKEIEDNLKILREEIETAKKEKLESIRESLLSILDDMSTYLDKPDFINYAEQGISKVEFRYIDKNNSRFSETIDEGIAKVIRRLEEIEKFSTLDNFYINIKNEIEEKLKLLKEKFAQRKIEVVEKAKKLPGHKPAESIDTQLSEEQKNKLIKAVLIERGRVKDELLSYFDLDGLKKELKRNEEALSTLQDQEEKDSLEGFISIIKDLISELEKSKTKQPKVASGPEPTPVPTVENKEVEDFVNKFDLALLLPPQFITLEENQKLKVIYNLKRRIVDIVKSDAQTQYSEGFKEKTFKSKVWSSIIKEKDLKNLEKKIFTELKNTEEGKNLLQRNLVTLSYMAKEQIIYSSSPSRVLYIDNKLGEDFKPFDNFNDAANAFVQIPYEWGQEKSGKHKRAYEKARIEFEVARDNLLQARSENKTPEEKVLVMTETIKAENAIKMEQLLNTHPEFEEALVDFETSEAGKVALKTLGNFWEGLKGKNFERLGLTAAGAGARILAKGAAIFTVPTGITLLATTVIGGAVGYWRGKFRAKDTLEERQKNARHGIKDQTKEKGKIIEIGRLNSGLEKMIYETENADGEERAKKLAKLKNLVAYVDEQVQKGQVNFGDAKSSLLHQFYLSNNLNRASVLVAMNTEDINLDLAKKISKALNEGSEERGKEISEEQEAFIKKQAKKGMIYGASFALAGYTVRALGEYFGWWGNVEAENTSDTKIGESQVSPETTEPLAYEKGLENNIKKEGLSDSMYYDKDKDVMIHKGTYWDTKITRDGRMHIIMHEGKEIPKEINPLKEREMSGDEIKFYEKIGFKINSPETTPTPATAEVNATIEAPSQTFQNECVTFEKGKGAIQGILDLKKQIREQYNGDYTNMPKSVQDFMNTDATKEAIKLGLFDPEDPSGKESALIQEGSMLKFDKDGNLLFGKPDADGNIPILEKYTGKMFDSDGRSKILPVENTTESEGMIKMPEEESMRNYQKIVGDEAVEKETPENTFLEDISEKEDKTESIRKEIFDKMEERRPNTIRTGTRIGVGGAVEPGRGPGGTNYYYDSRFPGMNMGGPQYYFPGLSPDENDFLNHHPEFANNPFHLDAETLVRTLKVHGHNVEHIFKDRDEWESFSNLKAKNWVHFGKIDEDSDPKLIYLNKLATITGIKPRGLASLHLRAETNGEYIARALQKAAEIGKLDQLKIEK